MKPTDKLLPGPESGWAELETGMWIGNSTPIEYLESAGFKTKKQPNGNIRIKLLERYENRAPRLITVSEKFSPFDDTQKFVAVERISDASIDDLHSADFRNRLSRFRKLVTGDNGGSIIDFVTSAQLLVSSSPADALRETVRETLIGIAGIKNESDQYAFPEAEAFILEKSELLLVRAHFPAVLARISMDPALRSGDLTEVRRDNNDGNPAFSSARSLTDGVYLLDAYVAPLQLCLTPAIWSFSVPRSHGVALFSFGSMVAGTFPTAQNLLDTVTLPSHPSTIAFNALTANQVACAVHWWTDRVNVLLSISTDPSIFASKTGQIDAQLQLEHLMSVEQSFRRTASLLRSHRDTTSAIALLFTILDTLESLLGVNPQKLFELKHAQKVLSRLEGSIPNEAQAVLLPRAVAGVKALEEFGEGFFLRAPDGTVPVSADDITGWGRQRAAAYLLKELRNATHGHGSNRVERRSINESLFARHSLQIPHDLCYLSLLYLMDLLVDDARLTRIIANKRRKQSAR